jgi:hypothetical protein
MTCFLLLLLCWLFFFTFVPSGVWPLTGVTVAPSPFGAFWPPNVTSFSSSFLFFFAFFLNKKIAHANDDARK